MRTSSMRALCAIMLATGVAAGGMAGAGTAFAAPGGLRLQGVSNGDCTATIKITNYTNSTYFQPDWWFEQENDPAMVNATSIPPEMPAPWREVSGIPWPIARWVGDSPALTSGLGPGVPSWGNGNPYNRNAQPDGFVTERTIDLKTVTGAPEPSEEGTKTIYFRIKTGPQTADRLPNPQKLVVEGCRSSNGSLDFGSLDFGSLGI